MRVKKHKFLIQIADRTEELLEFTARDNKEFLMKLKYGMSVIDADFDKDEIKILEMKEI